MADEYNISYLSDRRHDLYHHPIQDEGGEPIEANPYLTFPFTETDLIKAARKDESGRFNRRNLYYIDQGFIYNMEEKLKHGYHMHGGVDIIVPYGTPIVAPTYGYAISSYHSFPVRNPDGSYRLYEDKSVYMGLGYFVQIYNPDQDRYIQIGHMADIDESIPFSKPTLKNEYWNPTNHRLQIAEMIAEQNPYVTYVEQYQPLGFVGWSGLRHGGYEEHILESDRPIVIDHTKKKSWDDAHVHMGEMNRNKVTGDKEFERDPYDIYLMAPQNYPMPSRYRKLGPEPLWHLNTSELPKYSD